MEGIENLKKLVVSSLKLYESAAKGYEDKKISFFEAVGLIPELFAMFNAGKSINLVLEEINDGISDSERLDLENTVQSEFNVPNEKVKLFVQHALIHVVSTAALIYEFKHIKDPVV